MKKPSNKNASFTLHKNRVKQFLFVVFFTSDSSHISLSIALPTCRKISQIMNLNKKKYHTNKNPILGNLFAYQDYGKSQTSILDF